MAIIKKIIFLSDKFIFLVSLLNQLIQHFVGVLSAKLNNLNNIWCLSNSKKLI